MNRKLALLSVLFLTSCSKDPAPAHDYDPAKDYFTFSDTSAFITEHLALDLDVDDLAGRQDADLRDLLNPLLDGGDQIARDGAPDDGENDGVRTLRSPGNSTTPSSGCRCSAKCGGCWCNRSSCTTSR